MIRKNYKESLNAEFYLIKEVGYILLLIIFFVGIICGSFCMKKVSESDLDEYKASIEETLNSTNLNTKKVNWSSLCDILKTIFIFWIVGMSIIGMPVLLIYVGYKGFSLGYTIMTIIKILGTTNGNKYVFENLFLKNVIMVFVMIFLANYSIKIFRNFFKDKENIKIDAIKYSLVSGIICVLIIFICFFGRVLRKYIKNGFLRSFVLTFYVYLNIISLCKKVCVEEEEYLNLPFKRACGWWK